MPLSKVAREGEPVASRAKGVADRAEVSGAGAASACPAQASRATADVRTAVRASVDGAGRRRMAGAPWTGADASTNKIQ